MRLKALLIGLVMMLAATALAGCAGGGGSANANGELVVHDDPVPVGTPVMYEFFTQT